MKTTKKKNEDVQLKPLPVDSDVKLKTKHEKEKKIKDIVKKKKRSEKKPKLLSDLEVNDFQMKRIE